MTGEGALTTARKSLRRTGRRPARLLVTGLGLLLLALPACASSDGATAPTTPPTSRARTGPGSPSATGAAPTTATPTTSRPLQLTAAIVGARLPQPISRAVAVPSGDHLRVLGGRTVAHTSTDQVVDWYPGGPPAVSGRLARRVHDAAGVNVGGHTLLFGGGDGGSVADVQEVGAAGSGTKVGTLGTPRSDVCAAVVEGTAFVVGGYDDTGGVLDISTTSDGRTFTTAGHLPSEVRYGSAAALDGHVLVFGGEDANGSTDTVLSIDAATGTAAPAGTIPVRLSHAAAFVLRGEVYVAGGETNGARLANIWRYDQRNRSLVEVGRLPDQRSDAAVAVVGDTAYLVGGEGPGTLDSVVAVSVS